MIEKEKIGCDLDGVIATNHLNIVDYRPYRLHEYYSNAKPTGFHIRIPPDIIITGRRIHYNKLTSGWLANNGIGYEKLIMFPNKEKKSNKSIAEFKAKYINDYGLIAYYEDDERITELLKDLCPNTKIHHVREVRPHTDEDGKSYIVFVVKHISNDMTEHDYVSLYIPR